MQKILVVAALALLVNSAFAADADNTNSQYKATPAGAVNSGAVILQSDDGKASVPINSVHPLPVTGTVSSTPATPATAGPTAITNTQCSTLSSIAGQAAVGVLVTGTWTGTLTSSKSVDGTTFATTKAQTQPIGTATASVSITANGTYTLDTAGMSSVKVCGNTVSSGTATVSLRANTAAESSIDAIAAIPLPTTIGQKAKAASLSVTLPTDQSCATRVVSGAAEATHVLAAAASNICSITVSIGATSGYLMLFDATSAPVDGAVTPIYCAPVTSNGTNGAIGVSWPAAAPLVATTGISAAFSTTGCFTKTASSTASFFAMVQ